METKEQPKLRFLGMDFPSIELKSTKAIENSEDNIKVEITPRYFMPDGASDIFKIVMVAEVGVEGYFFLKIVGVGTFQVTGDITKEERKKLINANATAIVFPYVRSLIATITSNVGKVVTPILLPVRFFKGEMEEMVQPPKNIKIPVKKTAAKKISKIKPA